MERIGRSGMYHPLPLSRNLSYHLFPLSDKAFPAFSVF